MDVLQHNLTAWLECVWWPIKPSYVGQHRATHSQIKCPGKEDSRERRFLRL